MRSFPIWRSLCCRSLRLAVLHCMYRVIKPHPLMLLLQLVCLKWLLMA